MLYLSKKPKYLIDPTATSKIPTPRKLAHTSHRKTSKEELVSMISFIMQPVMRQVSLIMITMYLKLTIHLLYVHVRQKKVNAVSFRFSLACSSP